MTANLRPTSGTYFNKFLEDSVEVAGDRTGPPVVVWLRRKLVDEVFEEAAAQRSVGIYGISRCYLGRLTRPGFILGYSRRSEQEICVGFRILG